MLFEPLPAGPFGTALCDFPWNFVTRDRKRSVPGRAAADPYPTLTIAQGKTLPLADVMAKDAVLLMWTVSYLQDEATELAAAWGFRPVSLGLVWRKPSIGMGYWFRQEVEVQKLYTRGHPSPQSRSVRQVIDAPRREHSRKPDEQYERIEALCAGPYLELFGRHQRPGWTVWGNDVNRFPSPA